MKLLVRQARQKKLLSHSVGKSVRLLAFVARIMRQKSKVALTMGTPLGATCI